MSAGQSVSDDAALLDVGAVGRMLSCSRATVYRMADSGRMPRPIKLGSLSRWRRADLEEWITSGCQKVS